MEFDITVKGVRYHLQAYRRLMNEWDLIVDGKLICNRKPYDTCLWCFLDLIKEVDNNE